MNQETMNHIKRMKSTKLTNSRYTVTTLVERTMHHNFNTVTNCHWLHVHTHNKVSELKTWWHCFLIDVTKHPNKIIVASYTISSRFAVQVSCPADYFRRKIMKETSNDIHEFRKWLSLHLRVNKTYNLFNRNIVAAQHRRRNLPDTFELKQSA